MHMVEKILNNTTPYGKIRASHEGSLHSSTLIMKTEWYINMSDLHCNTNRPDHKPAVIVLVITVIK